MSAATTSLAEARTIFGTFMLGPDDVDRVLGSPSSSAAADVPFARADLERARARGDVLVFRADTEGTVPLTLGRLIERFPETLQPGLRKGVGYQLKDEWTVLQEPLTGSATCRPGWALVHASPVVATCNLNYEQQDGALARYNPDENGSTFSRRSAVEAAYDTILLNRAHGTRLLTNAFDWSDTPTQDGGFVTVGQFEEDGLRIVGYSRAVRFGTLGVCPQRRA
jgi:hypothetical protein